MMPIPKRSSRPRQRMAVVAGYLPGESYGLLGPQLAATIVQEHGETDCIVVAVTRDDERSDLVRALADYFGGQRPIVGFSYLSGNPDLAELAGELKRNGAVTLLAGPQADVDYAGETGWRDHGHRYNGFRRNFSFGLHGPAEQLVPFLRNPQSDHWQSLSGVVCPTQGGRIIRQTKKKWNPRFLANVDWSNLYRLNGATLVNHRIAAAQVLQQIGCPHAAKQRRIEIDYPTGVNRGNRDKIAITSRGCSFCDVAVDKGFFGRLDDGTVLAQIQNLPQTADGRKIPFELINENPLPGLPGLLRRIEDAGIRLSQINLTLRADWLVRGESYLRAALEISEQKNVGIVLSSVGFESFDDRILDNLNKGLTVADNLAAVALMRRLKSAFPQTLGYLRSEGGNHGFIHPTPWDTPQSEANIQQTIAAYSLPADILPAHSTPLIIHHASALADWIRVLEKEMNIVYPRQNSWIAWWERPQAML